MIALYLLAPAVLLLFTLTGWRFGWWTGRRLLCLLWLLPAAGLGLCGLFQLYPGLAPAVLADRLDPVVDHVVEAQPLLGLLRQRPWLALGAAAVSAVAPSLLRLHGRLRRLALGKGLATAPRPTPRIGELSANGTPTPAAGRAGGAPLVLTVGMVGPWRSGKSELTDAACLGVLFRPLQTLSKSCGKSELTDAACLGLRACESNLGLRIIREKATSPFRREQERATFFFDGIHNPTTASASHRRPPATHPDHAPGKPP